MYHLRDGLFFARSNATDVCIIKTADGKTPWRQSREAGQPFDTNIVFELTVPENEWASVVASVSVLGENSQRWNAARDFHTNPEDSTQALADASHAIVVLRGMLERGAADPGLIRVLETAAEQMYSGLVTLRNSDYYRPELAYEPAYNALKKAVGDLKSVLEQEEWMNAPMGSINPKT